MKHKGLAIHLMLVLVVVVLLVLPGTTRAQEPTPNIESSSPESSSPEVLDSPSTLTVASPGSILIYGPSMSPPTSGRPHNEQTLAQAAGHTVTVADAATWSTFTTAQFAAFDAIVFGDRTCATSTSLLSAAEANKAVWSAAITGPIYVQGTDPQYHIYLSQAQTMITSGINFAASGPGTGLYASLSCYYANKPRYTTVSFLSQIGNFQAGPQEGCPAVVTIVDPAHPAMAGLTNAGLSNWGCTAHDFLLSFPSSFNVLATAIRPSDGADLPFIIATSANEPPTADPNGPYYGDEGSPVTFDGTGSSDPDGDPLTYDWDFGDGSPIAYNVGPTPSHTYDDNGVYDICLTVTDPGGLSDTQCASTKPMDVVFALDSSGSMQWNDPSGLRKTAAKSFVDMMDSSQDTAGVVSWDYSIDFTYPLSSDFPTVKWWIDQVNSSGGTNLDVGLNAAISLLDSGKQAGASWAIIFLSNGQGTYTPAASGGPAAVAAAKGYVIYSIGLGPSPATSALTDMANATGGQYYPAPTAENLQAIFDDIYVAVTGKAFIANVAPTATFNAPTEVNEGNDINLSLTGPYDPSNADTLAGFEYAFDCGDGGGYGAWSSNNTATCPTDDNGMRTVKGKIRDKDGGETEYTADVTIHNVPPTATFNAPTYVIAGDDFELSLTDPYDPSSADTDAGFTYAFDCGDGGGYGGLGFTETGDLSEWNLTIPPGGIAQVSSSYYSYPANTLYAPKTGSEFVLMKTNGPGSYTTAARTFVAKAGETISGWAFFDARDYMPFNDDAQVTIRLDGTVLATLFSASVSTVGDYGETPWTYWEYTFTSDGSYTLEAKITNALDSILDSYMGLDVLVNATICGTSPDEVGDRTVKGKIRDKDGGETEYEATVTILPPSAATDSALCYYDRAPDIDGQQFRLIFTPDMQVWPAYKLPASNPGQFFYNVFYTGAGTADFDITVPEPFETQGANPVHVYTGVSVVEIDGFKCFVPDLDSEIYAGDFSGLSGLSDPGGFLYVTVHLDYDLKGTTGYIPNFNNDALDATDEVTVLIPNLNDYTFSVSSSQNDSRTIQNANDFKKIPGFGGLVTDGVGDPVAGATVVITLEGEELGQATTDADGWYMFVYKHTGKPADYTVALQGYGLSESGTLKANKFAEVNFVVD